MEYNTKRRVLLFEVTHRQKNKLSMATLDAGEVFLRSHSQQKVQAENVKGDGHSDQNAKIPMLYAACPHMAFWYYFPWRISVRLNPNEILGHLFSNNLYRAVLIPDSPLNT